MSFLLTRPSHSIIVASSSKPPQASHILYRLHRHSEIAYNMLARATRPKLMLAVPTTTPTTLTKSPLPRTPISPCPISPTVHNTRLNQRGFSTMQPPTFAYAQPSNTKSILKKGQKGQTSSSASKKLQFREEPAVRCISPVPEDYHGTYVKMSKDERRWGSGRDL